tara:strand:+ start:1308 stop:1823 length:516 start_codon:yes stop_codon:yes gene_type:complete
MVKSFHTDNRNYKDEWLTPPSIPQTLGKFDLDPCQPINPPFVHAPKGYNILDDGLSKDWEGRVWCNPPYGRETFKWVEKLADHGWGTALIFARTDTIGFHEQVWARADALFFIRGRIKFHHVDGTQSHGSANASSVLIAYGAEDVQGLEKAVGEIPGALVYNNIINNPSVY